ncbi:MAG: SLATT domain-containing protein [Anaerolineae bacterium]|nr:SLATT domain-containing protein [Anaerolineae bacterium]
MPDTVPPAHQTNQDEEYQRGYELALAYAWHRFNSYDSESGHLKNRYARIRLYIIAASLATTILSVFSVVARSARYWELGFLLFGLFLFIISLRMVTGYHQMDWMTPRTRARLASLGAMLRGEGGARQPPAARAARVEASPAEPSEAEKQAGKRRTQVINVLRTVLIILMSAALFVTGALFWIFSQGAEEIVAYRGESGFLLPVRLVLIMLLIALPLLSSGLLDFAARFESRRNWVGFRLGAERIRRAVYILRVRNYYKELTASDLQELNDVVKDTRATLNDMGVTAPLLSQDFDPERDPVAPNYVYRPEDDGYSEMSIEDYFVLRLIPQLNWYRDRIQRDYKRTRYYRGYILMFGALGALLTALGLSEFAAITAACVTAIVTWLALMSHEQNYRVYASTLSRLEEEAADYKVCENTATTEDKIRFVWNVEKVLADELENWSQGVLQAQDVIEDNLGKMTKRESGEDRFEPGASTRPEADRAVDVRGEVAAPPPAEARMTALPDIGDGNPAPVTEEQEPTPEPGD